MCARRLLQSFFLHSDVLRDTDDVRVKRSFAPNYDA